MRLMLSLFFTLIIVAGPAVADERQDVADLFESYRQIWLRNDRTVEPDIMELLTPRAAIMPEGMPVLSGHQQIRDFWFPADAPRMRIKSYEQAVARVEVSGDLAYVYGEFALSFRADRKNLSRQGTQMMVVRRFGDDWKIEALIWTSMSEPDAESDD